MRKNFDILACFIIVIALFLIGAVLFVVNTKATPPPPPALTFDTGQVSCTGSATALVSQVPQRTGLLITNPGTVAVYIGNTSVATNTGAYLPGGGSVSIPTKDAVSCISSGASQTVTYLETYNTF
jgi:hypothetical protein